MEMIGPKTFIKKFEKSSLEEIKLEREKINEEILDLENNNGKSDVSKFLYPDNDTKLYVYKSYLNELDDLIKNYNNIK